MNPFLQDLRYALRMLIKNPGFSAVAILTLALGIGANTAVFSVVSAVLLRPLPFPEPDRIMSVWEGAKDRTYRQAPLSVPDFEDWRAQNRSFEALEGYSTQTLTLTERGREPARIESAEISAGLFAMLRINPAMGRSFLPAEDQAGNRSIILSDALWRRRFGADKEVLGRSILFDGRSYQVVGVMPPGFRFPVQNEPVEAWTTLAGEREIPPGGGTSSASERGNHFLRALGRLRPGVSVAQAQANLNNIAAALAKQYPDDNANFPSAIVHPLLADLTDDVRPALLTLLGAAACVLLIACVNVANLLLARASVRGREMAIRAALGAGRGRIVRQLLTESLLLALLGGAVGLLFALWGTDGVTALLPPNFPRGAEIHPDGRVLLFTGLVSLVTGALFGLAPAWRISRPDVAAGLNESARGSTESGRSRRLRGALVVAELVLAFVLLVGAGLLIRSFWRLQSVSPGFDPKGVFTVNVALPDGSDADFPIRNANFYQQLLERAAALPGVRSVSAVSPLPLGGSDFATGCEIAGRPQAKSEWPVSHFRVVSPAYFRTMGIPLRQGRDFDARDIRGSAGAIIVNETFARTVFPGENPIGKRITPQVSFDASEPMVREIVGVVGDVKFRKISTENQAEVYVPHAQASTGGMTLVVRAEGASAALLPALRQAVGAIDKDLPLYKPRSMEDYLAASFAQPKLNMALLLIFAGLAAVLTAVGIYGVMSYSVAQRTPEIGIRMALGAQRTDILRLVVFGGLKLAAVGVIAGLLLALALTRFLSSLLYEIGATDLPTLGIVALVLAAVAAFACWLPAQRAAGVNPMTALRD